MNSNFHACNCIGPQKGQPLCPCRMANVTIKNGRYIETIDHGQVRSYDETKGVGWLFKERLKNE